jgi:hypothetical protein
MKWPLPQGTRRWLPLQSELAQPLHAAPRRHFDRDRELGAQRLKADVVVLLPLGVSAGVVGFLLHLVAWASVAAYLYDERIRKPRMEVAVGELANGRRRRARRGLSLLQHRV